MAALVLHMRMVLQGFACRMESARVYFDPGLFVAATQAAAAVC